MSSRLLSVTATGTGACRICGFDLGADEGFTSDACESCVADLAQDEIDREAEIDARERETLEFEREIAESSGVVTDVG